MSDRRRIQRTLFRMQADADFAAALRAGEAEAAASTGLDADDLATLCALDPAGVSADPEGRRRAQLLGNVTTEFTLFLAALAAAGRGELLRDFLGSPEFHAAIAGDGRLPLAFAAWGADLCKTLDEPALGSVIALEGAMATLRRAREEPPALDALDVVLAPAARVAVLPAGTLAHAAALRGALEDGRAAPAAPPGLGRGEGNESVLLLARPAVPHRLADVTTEALQPPVAALLRFVSVPRDATALARFAAENGAAPAELAAFVDELVGEGVLLRG